MRDISESIAGEVNQILLGPPGGSEFVEGVDYRENNFEGVLNKIRTIKRIRAIADDVDLIHSHFAYPSGVLAEIALLGKEIPHVITSHGADIQRDCYRSDPKKEWLIKWALGRATTHVVLSEKMKQRALDLEPEENITRINAIIGPFSEERSDILEEEDIEKPYILYLGRLEEIKGVEYLIRAFDELDYEVNLVIAGDGSEKDKLEELTEKLDLQNVYFPGFVLSPHKEELLRNCELVCAPSLNEVIAGQILEAEYFGKPAVATRVGGHPEVLPDKFLAEPKDPKSLRSAMESGLREEYESSIDIEDWSPQRVGEQHIQLYEEILGN